MPNERRRFSCFARLFVVFLLSGLLGMGPMPAMFARQAVAAPGAQPDAAGVSEAGDHAQPSKAERQAAAERYQGLVRAAQLAIQELPRESFDVQAVAGRVGDDPAALLAWVADETRWVSYEGVLRGARGVLMDRMGNSLDRSLLLAALLMRTGHEVRLARGTLDEATAQALWAALPSAAVAAQPQAELQTLAEMADSLGFDPKSAEANVDEARLRAMALHEDAVGRSYRHTRHLAKQLGWDDAASAEQAAMKARPGDLAALADHWWVERLEGEQWVALDPMAALTKADGVAEPGATLAAAEAHHAVDDLPDEVHHRLTVEVVAEQWRDGALSEAPALRHEMRAVDLFGRELSIGMAPLDWPSDMALFEDDVAAIQGKLREAVLAQDEWLPMLKVGRSRIEQGSIRADGSVNESPMQSGQGRAMEDAAGLLGKIGVGGGDDRDASHLTAVHLRYTLDAPGRETQRMQRALMDVVGPAAREAERVSLEMDESLRFERGAAMMGEARLLAQTSWISEAYVTGLQLQQFLRNRQVMMGVLHGAWRHQPQQIIDSAAHLERDPIELLALGLVRQRWSPHADVTALTQINLLSIVQLVSVRDGQMQAAVGYDIVHNPVDVRPGAASDARRVRLMQGVVDTNAELLALEAETSVLNAADAYERATSGAEPAWTVVRSADEVDAQLTELDADTRSRLRDTVEAGHWVVARGDATARGPVWWEVDPATGRTLGMAGDGRGNALLEWIVIAWPGISAIVLLIGMGMCLSNMRGHVTLKDLCCMAVAVGGAIVGMGIGALVGALTASLAINLATAVVWDASGFVTEGLICPKY